MYKQLPAGFSRITASVYYDDAAAAIDWLVRAFGYSVRLRIEGPGGQIEHSELEYGEGVLMVGETSRRPGRKSPQSLGGANTQCLMVYVDDVDAHCAKARAAGAKILQEPADHDYGQGYWCDRCYEAEDPEGHRWWIAQRIQTGKPQ